MERKSLDYRRFIHYSGYWRDELFSTWDIILPAVIFNIFQGVLKLDISAWKYLYVTARYVTSFASCRYCRYRIGKKGFNVIHSSLSVILKQLTRCFHKFSQSKGIVILMYALQSHDSLEDELERIITRNLPTWTIMGLLHTRKTKKSYQ